MSSTAVIAFMPSAKRMLPYPPVAPFLLASALQRAAVEPRVVDLEIVLNDMHARDVLSLVYERELTVDETLLPELAPDVQEYGELLLTLTGGADVDIVALSVMGFHQLASGMLLARMALSAGRRVILGGQFWTTESARQALRALAPYGEATITVGDGWEAIVSFATKPHEVPVNSHRLRDGKYLAGGRMGMSSPPQPDFSLAAWPLYTEYGTRVYRRPDVVRRSHLYLWDKICNFRCAFCRVASGSNARLTTPNQALESLERYAEMGIEQVNVMTNELNPSRDYMLRFLKGMRERGLTRASWLSYVRADRLEHDDFQLMREVGGRFARYGVESGSQRLLDLMRKDYDVPTMSRTLKAAADADVFNHINLLVGFPGETRDDVEQSVRFLEDNAENIHSVRINPFYLPPDTPMARAPDEFGIRLTRFNKGWWEFEYQDGAGAEPQTIVDHIETLAQACVRLGIGFSGNDPFLVLDALACYPRRDDAIARLKRYFGFLWEATPPAVYQARIGNYNFAASWQDTVLKRGRQYSLLFCTD